MQIKPHVTLAALALLSPTAFAQDYQTEINAEYGRFDSDEDIIHRADIWGLSGTYYFSPVDIQNHPLAEAAFLERASNLALSYRQAETRSEYASFGTEFERKLTSKTSGANIEIYIPNTIFYVGAAILDGESKSRLTATSNGETTTQTYTDDSGSTWSASLGVTPVDGLLVWTDFYEDVDLKDYWNINAKYVTELGDNAINIEATYANGDDHDSAHLLGDYYFDRSFSVGAGYYYSNNSDDSAYIIRTKKFFTDAFSVHADYLTSDYEDAFNVGASVRF